MASRSATTVADAAATVSITIPANGAAATLRSLMTVKLAAIPANLKVIGAKIIGQAAAFQWGDAANNCIIPVTSTEVMSEPIHEGILDAFFETASGGSTTAKVLLYLGSSAS